MSARRRLVCECQSAGNRYSARTTVIGTHGEGASAHLRAYKNCCVLSVLVIIDKRPRCPSGSATAAVALPPGRLRLATKPSLTPQIVEKATRTVFASYGAIGIGDHSNLSACQIGC